MLRSTGAESRVTASFNLGEGLTADVVEWSGPQNVWLDDGHRGPVVACQITWAGPGRSETLALLSVGDERLLHALAEPRTRPGAMIVVRPCGIWWRSFIQRLEPGEYHVPDDLMAALIDAVRVPVSEPGQRLSRSTRCRQVISELLDRAERGDLVARSGPDGLSLVERDRIVAARQMIRVRFAEKLTLETVARACGLNRAKLTRGFRILFNRTVMECLQEDRLENAARALRTTSEPVSLIGYAAGYLNDASFSRAFSRRFGASPTAFRRGLAPRTWSEEAVLAGTELSA